ncbi:MAG: metal ABC transporter substrate-binding protein [Acidimicrobiales bacterium]
MVVFAAVLVGCSTGRSEVARAGGDYAEVSSGGDPETAAAIRRVADFRCPEEAVRPDGPVVALPPGRRLRVVTTVAPLTSIVANVAGDRAEVSGVVPEGTDSHTFEPKPSVAELFGTADVVFLNGLALEDVTAELAERNVRPGTRVVELGTTALRPDEYIFDFSFPRDAGKPNPHLWTNPPMARCYAMIAAGALAVADPPNAASYLANAEAFGAKVDDLDRRFQAASDTVLPANRALLTYHDAYAYFAAHYRWRIVGAIQVSSFEDPTAKDVAGIIAQVEAEGVPAIFGSEVFPSPVLEQIGEEAGVTYVDELRDDDLPGAPGDPDHSYLCLMKADFVTMVSSLGGDPSGLSAFDPTDVVRDSAGYPQ